VTVELTAKQITDRDKAHLAVQAQETAEADAKAAARTSALAKLAALGLTADEIAAL
jgi:hypothetical protein